MALQKVILRCRQSLGFCHLKRSYIAIVGEEVYIANRNAVYLEYPDEWSASTTSSNGAEADDRKPEDRPLAMKSALNPKGKLSSKEVFERSLFSIRCDLYL